MTIMARQTDNMMVGGDALSAVLEKTKATIDSVNSRVTATEQKATLLSILMPPSPLRDIPTP
jgi:hypothetical protein